MAVYDPGPAGYVDMTHHHFPPSMQARPPPDEIVVIEPPTMPAKTKKSKKEEVLPVLQNFALATKAEKLQALYDQWYNCQRCQLSKERAIVNHEPQPDIVFGQGNPDAAIMIVGEAPGEEEEKVSEPFVGASGRLLNQLLATVSDDQGIQEMYAWYNGLRRNSKDYVSHQTYFHEKMMEYRRNEYFITNVVACRPPDNRAPAKPEIEACWERLYNLIYIVEPKLIIGCGKYAVSTLVHKQVEITKKRGEIFDIPIQGRLAEYRVPMMATLHPSFLLRQADWKLKDGFYMKTLRDFLSAHLWADRLMHLHFGKPVPKRVTL